MTTRRRFLAGMLAAISVPGWTLRGLRTSMPGVGPASAWPAETDPQYWLKLRGQFLLPRDSAFFNSGTLGAMPRPVLQATVDHLTHVARDLAQWDYKPDHEQYFSGYFAFTELRSKVGALIGADAEEIALTQNATMGMNFIANGLELQPGDEVIQTDQEHPGGRCGWELRQKRYGVVWKTVKVPIPPESPQQLVDLVTGAITERTAVIAVPHITSTYGIVFPVKEICRIARDKGIFTVIDGAQSVGQIHVNVKEIGCDAYFSSPHKWLLAPAGNGFLYVRKGIQSRVWTTLASAQWDNQKDAGFRLQQRGTGNLSLLVGLNAAIDFHNRIGSERVEARIRELTSRLRAGLQKIKGVRIYSPLHPDLSAGMTTYGIEGVPGPKIQDELWERGRLRPRSVGEIGVRQSCHIYNSEAEVDKTLELVAELARVSRKG